MSKHQFYIHRMDLCHNCMTESIELYDYFNNPLDYGNSISKMIRGEPFSLKNKRSAAYTFRCKKCGKSYPIRWIGNIPVPIQSPVYSHEFMDLFKHLNDKEKG